MNILIFSDSHGKSDNIKQAIYRQIVPPDAVVFLGDGLRDMMYAELDGIPTYCVQGNCDGVGYGVFDAPDELFLTLGTKRIFITHGHRYHVKSVLSSIIQRAGELGADIALFGHTHQPFEKLVDVKNEYGIRLSKPLLLMNPGSIGSYPYSFGNIEINAQGIVIASHGSLV